MPADHFEDHLRAGLGRLASDARVSAGARERLHRRAHREPIRRMGVVVVSYAMVVAAAAALFVGIRFSDDDRGTAVLPSPTSSRAGTTTTTAPATTTTAPSADPGSTTRGGSNPATTPTTAPTRPPEPGPGFSTAAKRGTGTPGPIPPLPRVVRMEAGRHDDEGFDRVVIEFDRGLPGYDIGYVSRVTQDGSGAAVSLLGSADLNVRITPADAHDDDGNGTLRVTRLTPGFRAIKEVRLVSDFEGYVTIGVGTDGRRPFKVSELSGPNRLVIDFAQSG